MNEFVKRAQEILKKSEVLSLPKGWKPIGEVPRNGKRAVLFSEGTSSGDDGELYVYENGEMEFVVVDDEGKEHSASLAQVEEAKNIYDREHEPFWGFSGLVVREGKVLYEFMDEDAMMWRPRVLVDLENRTTEYIPDEIDDEVKQDIPF